MGLDCHATRLKGDLGLRDRRPAGDALRRDARGAGLAAIVVAIGPVLVARELGVCLELVAVDAALAAAAGGRRVPAVSRCRGVSGACACGRMLHVCVRTLQDAESLVLLRKPSTVCIAAALSSATSAGQIFRASRRLPLAGKVGVSQVFAGRGRSPFAVTRTKWRTTNWPMEVPIPAAMLSCWAGARLSTRQGTDHC